MTVAVSPGLGLACGGSMLGRSSIPAAGPVAGALKVRTSAWWTIRSIMARGGGIYRRRELDRRNRVAEQASRDSDAPIKLEWPTHRSGKRLWAACSRVSWTCTPIVRCDRACEPNDQHERGHSARRAQAQQPSEHICVSFRLNDDPPQRLGR